MTILFAQVNTVSTSIIKEASAVVPRFGAVVYLPLQVSSGQSLSFRPPRMDGIFLIEFIDVGRNWPLLDQAASGAYTIIYRLANLPEVIRALLKPPV